MKTVEAGTTRIGWIGTGVMGRHMCRHLIQTGYSTTVFSRTPEKLKSLVELGAQQAKCPREVAENSDVVFTMVGFPDDLRAVTFGDDGTLAGSAIDTVLVDMSTSRPSLAVEIFNAARDQDVHSIDAPVSGGDIGAQEARLSIMIGGEEDVALALMPMWETMGNTVVHQGGPGTGQHTKMVNQTLIASNMIGVCEALLYAVKSGLDLECVLQSVAGGAAGSWSLSNLAPRMIANDYDPGFFVEHFIKDMGIALEESERMGLKLPGLALAKELYDQVAEQGHSRDGTQALILALGKLSALDWKNRA